MIIQDLFSKDINRSINGVVKVQDAATNRCARSSTSTW